MDVKNSKMFFWYFSNLKLYIMFASITEIHVIINVKPNRTNAMC